MAERLATVGGFTVHAWNRTAEKAAPLAQHGVVVCQQVEAAVQPASYIVLILADAAAIEEWLLLRDSVRELLRGRTVVQMGTIGAAAALRTHAMACHSLGKGRAALSLPRPPMAIRTFIKGPLLKPVAAAAQCVRPGPCLLEPQGLCCAGSVHVCVFTVGCCRPAQAQRKARHWGPALKAREPPTSRRPCSGASQRR